MYSIFFSHIPSISIYENELYFDIIYSINGNKSINSMFLFFFRDEGLGKKSHAAGPSVPRVRAKRVPVPPARSVSFLPHG